MEHPGLEATHPGSTAEARPKAGSGRQMVMVGSLLAAAAIGLILVTNILVSLLTEALAPSTKVVVAAHDVSLRSQLTASDLSLLPVAKKDAGPGEFTRLDEVSGHGYVAQINISKGQPITRSMLARSADSVVGPQPAYLPIAQGFVASTVPTGLFQGVGGYIQAGDYINVIAIINSNLFEGNSDTQVVQTVFTNVHVIRVGQATNSVSEAGSGAASTSQRYSNQAATLTVVTTQCDAEFLTWLLNYATVVYTLGSYKDYKPQDTKPDPSCKDAAAAQGVGPKVINSRWHITDKSLGPNSAPPAVPTN